MKDCHEVRDAFIRSEVEASDELDRHVRDCAQCRELFEGDGELGRSLGTAASSTVPFEDALFARVTAEVAHETGLRAFLRSRPSRLRFSAVAASALLVVALCTLRSVRPDLGEYPAARLLVVPGLYAFVTSLAFMTALSLPTRRGSRAASAWVFLGSLGLSTLLAFTPATGASRGAGPDGWFSCFLNGTLSTLPVAVLLWLFDRNDRPTVRMAVLSAAGLGACANLMLELRCPSGNAFHLCLGHASIGVAWFFAWLGLRLANRA